jgi:hypothetical protein
MSDRMEELEARVVELAATVQRLEGRLAALEARPAQAAAAVRRRPASLATLIPSDPGADARSAAALGGSVSLVGRTLLVLAGAFLLRALTDAGTLPTWLGILLGLAYAGTWILLADRASAAGRRASAAFHGVAAIVIGYPLLFEALTRFRLLSPAAVAALLAALSGVALAVAARRRFEALAWLAALGGAATAIAIVPIGGRVAPSALYLVALGVATLWLGYLRGWVYLRWPIAVAADLAVVALALRAVRAGSPEGPWTLLVVELALVALYLGSTATRTVLLDRAVVPFEMVQTAAVLAIGLGGGAFAAARAGSGALGLGAASLAIGVAAYAVAFAFTDRERHRVNFYFYGLVALVSVLAGAALALPDGALPLALGALAVALGAVSRRAGRLTLSAHAAAYGVAAIAVAGLLSTAARATFGHASAAARPSLAALVVLALAAAAAWVTGGAGARRTTVQRLPRLVLVAALAIGIEAVVLGAIVPRVGDAGAVATVRTAVLVAAAFLLAWLGRSEAWHEAGWLVHPLLAATGLKLLLEDVSRSRPATLFLAFAAYGAALLVVPRLRRREAAPPSPAPAR